MVLVDVFGKNIVLDESFNDLIEMFEAPDAFDEFLLVFVILKGLQAKYRIDEGGEVEHEIPVHYAHLIKVIDGIVYFHRLELLAEFLRLTFIKSF